VNATLETLIQLQEIDTVILDSQQKIAEFPEIVRQLDQQLQKQENKVSTLQTRLEEQEKSRGTKELDIESREAKIKKYQEQLLQVKTNKEYSALLVEIKGLKNKNSLTEDDILELMESIDRTREAIVEARQELEQERKRVSEVKHQKEVENAEQQQILDREQQQRDQLAARVEDKVLQEYDKLLKLRNGKAVAMIEEKGICSGCHVALTPQMFAEVKTGEYVHRCPICSRFLFWSDNSGSSAERPQEPASQTTG
jgi:uncharacterized protein